MSERQPINCGPLDLVWTNGEYEGQLGQSGFGFVINIFRHDDQLAWEWEIERPSNAPVPPIVKSTDVFDTAKQATDDLAKFLGELGAVLGPFVPKPETKKDPAPNTCSECGERTIFDPCRRCN